MFYFSMPYYRRRYRRYHNYGRRNRYHRKYRSTRDMYWLHGPSSRMSIPEMNGVGGTVDRGYPRGLPDQGLGAPQVVISHMNRDKHNAIRVQKANKALIDSMAEDHESHRVGNSVIARHGIVAVGAIMSMLGVGYSLHRVIKMIRDGILHPLKGGGFELEDGYVMDSGIGKSGHTVDPFPKYPLPKHLGTGYKPWRDL